MLARNIVRLRDDGFDDALDDRLASLDVVLGGSQLAAAYENTVLVVRNAASHG